MKVIIHKPVWLTKIGSKNQKQDIIEPGTFDIQQVKHPYGKIGLWYILPQIGFGIAKQVWKAWEKRKIVEFHDD